MSLPGVKKGTLTFSQKNVPEAKPTKKKIYDPLKGDPNAPKKPIIQAYLMYYSDIRSQTQKEHPDLPNKDLTKIIADEWNSMPKDKRAVSLLFRLFLNNIKEIRRKSKKK